LGSSDGLTGSTAILITDAVLNFSGLKIWAYTQEVSKGLKAMLFDLDLHGVFFQESL
jgi:hypothetical protein